jgi:hypothetical protein
MFCTALQAEPASDACMKVANARLQEWNQARLLRDRMDTYADGSTLNTEIIFTENGMFHLVKGIWRTGQATRRERSAGSASSVIHNMGFTDCTADGAEDVDGQRSAVYSYEQGPDMKSRIWISEATGLPLRAEVRQVPKRRDIPAKIVMTYIYDDNVHVPHTAELKNFERLARSQTYVRDQSSMSPGVVH